MTNVLFDCLLGETGQSGKICMETPGGSALTFAELRDESGRVANALGDYGVKPGDRVAVQVEKSIDAIALYIGTIRAGAVFLPLNPAYTPAEISYFLEDARPALFVAAPGSPADDFGFATRFGAGGATLGSDGTGSFIERARISSPEFATVSRGESDLAAILYTSGTTGRSKGAMLTHGNLASNARTLAAYWRFTGEDVLLHALPIYHTHGLFVATNIALLTGGSMLFLPRFDAAQIVAQLPRATAMMGVPTFYTRLLDREDFTADLVRHMRVFIAGSAPLSAETHRAFSARTGHAIIERYGMTETGMNSSNPYDGERRPGSVGLPLPEIAMRVADPETGAIVPTGEIGMLEVKGPNVFSGYWQMPEKTAAEFRADGFFITGDLGKIDAGGYVTIVGRGKDLIISGGLNIYPKEVEAQIEAIPGVAEAAVIGLPHPDFGEGVAAVIVLAKDAQLVEGEIARQLEGNLARFKQPKRIFIVSELPRNTMGKVLKKMLREQYQDGFR